MRELPRDDPTIRPANKMVPEEGYWFFKWLPETIVDVIDDWSPMPISVVEGLSRVEQIQALRALIIQRNYDVVLSHSYSSGFVFSMIRSIFGGRHPAHFIIDVGCLNGNRESRAQIAAIGMSLKSVDGLIYHSTVNEDFYSSHFPDLNRRFVPLGLDTSYFKPLDENPSEDYALSIGTRFRDYETLANAWKGVDYPLRIVGQNRRTINRNRNITFTPEVPINELNALIHNARLIVLPIEGRRYSVGQMTVLQCMAMKKTIIVTDVPGISDYVSNGANCLTIREGSKSDIRNAVQLALRDENLSARLAEKARSDAVAKFDERAMASGILSFMRECLGEKTEAKSWLPARPEDSEVSTLRLAI